MIFYRTESNQSENLFVFNEILAVYELFVYELLKCLLQSWQKAMKNHF